MINLKASAIEIARGTLSALGPDNGYKSPLLNILSIDNTGVVGLFNPYDLNTGMDFVEGIFNDKAFTAAEKYFVKMGILLQVFAQIPYKKGLVGNHEWRTDREFTKQAEGMTYSSEGLELHHMYIQHTLLPFIRHFSWLVPEDEQTSRDQVRQQLVINVLTKGVLIAGSASDESNKTVRFFLTYESGKTVKEGHLIGDNRSPWSDVVLRQTADHISDVFTNFIYQQPIADISDDVGG